MRLITAVRSQGPGPAPTMPVRADAPDRKPMVAAAPAVVAPTRVDAPRQPEAATATVAARLAERDEGDHPAAEARIAADAARAAYIKASIAAGISPLPLP